MPSDRVQKVLVLGSGALKIGEAGEFDYSGSQAIKAFTEEGIETVLVNPNIATVQTSQGLADKVYLLPVQPQFVKDIIERERPDAIFLSCGGQTALNCGLELAESGVLDEAGVQVLGTSIESIRDAEDRQRFADRLRSINVKTPESKSAKSLEESIAVADAIGYPVMVRFAYTLGGLGSGRCADRAEFVSRVTSGFVHSSQVLVEEYLEGWKEVEYEIVRDRFDNCVAICNMENLDPLGIHTGESIVVAPSQTLDNDEYHLLRDIGIRVFRALGLVGEGNIQFALHPKNGDYRVIEVNPRLSRSSALASKATGYPLAYIATKLALGYGLADIQNPVTQTTTACFEPALDYIVVKIPRWDLSKFVLSSSELGTGMKSVGEVMGIGRSFEEALQKALRMVDTGAEGLIEDGGFDRTEELIPWGEPRPDRILRIGRALANGVTANEISRVTHIHPWFVAGVENIVAIGRELRLKRGQVLSEVTLRRAKQAGFSDVQIAGFIGASSSEVASQRSQLGLHPAVKQIDTFAGEFPASTNYLYLTYHGSANDVQPLPEHERPVVLLGAGPYRIGCSVEFDCCCVEAARSFRRRGHRTVIINCNPETVSTDYDESDRLYFEELSLETIIEILRLESPIGVVVSMGGQISNSLAGPLKAAGVPIFGTDPDDIDRAEDRHAFSRMLDREGIKQPAWREMSSISGVLEFCEDVGFPVLVRPSYVLSGSAMAIATGPAELSEYLTSAADAFSRAKVVVSRFIEDGKEIELDGVAAHGEIVSMTIGEHIENAGVHSGDATIVVPPQRIFSETDRRIREIGRKIARALNITGPFNVQFIARENDVMVIECNLRASRSLPFVSKVTNYPYMEAAVAVFLGEEPPVEEVCYRDLKHVGVKAPQFSYSRLQGVDPRVGVEMASTGEVGCLGESFEEAFMKALIAVGFRFPVRAVLLSTGPLKDKVAFLEGARHLSRSGAEIFATRGSARFLSEQGVHCNAVGWPDDGEPNTAEDLIRNRRVDLVVNIPKNNQFEELSNDAAIRKLAVEYGLPLVTNIQLACRLALMCSQLPELQIRSLDEYHSRVSAP
ncbi:MAG: carbamoyl-phosphate synthase (glutamine-hydrolyzing) large subunit [Planctomycetota bacterium]